MPTTDRPRLIERAFPLRQASLDSVHEKNVRHGHISTLHIWPARRPLAACRAALIATLLPDPGDPDERRRLIERIGGRIRTTLKKDKNGKQVECEETEGGILHWGRESGPDIEFFREEIKKAYGGRAPRVLDPFAGGGAIPLEAMRLGCEVTASDINPVAWFILKCTLEYPQKLAGKKLPLPDFALRDRDFMEQFLKKTRGLKGARLRAELERLGLGGTPDSEKGPSPGPADRPLPPGGRGPDRREAQPVPMGRGTDEGARQSPERSEETPSGLEPQTALAFRADPGLVEADLAWHVRAWGRWVLARARADLERFYPTIDGKPTVAYLWARTVKCKNCRATIPLLKTKWLCRKDKKRVLLTVEPAFSASASLPPGGRGRRGAPGEGPQPLAFSELAKSESYGAAPDAGAAQRRTLTPTLSQKGEGASRQKREQEGMLRPDTVRFGIQTVVPRQGGNAAQQRAHDKEIGRGTMSRSGATCPCCGLPSMKMEDIRLEGKAGRLGAMMTAVVVNGPKGKEYRLPTEEEIRLAAEAGEEVERVFSEIPFGIPDEPLPSKEALGFRVPLYGFDRWSKLFTPRQLLALGTFVKHTRAVREGMLKDGNTGVWGEAIGYYLPSAIDFVANRSSTICSWTMTRETIRGTFARFALPIVWDFAESSLLETGSGGYVGAVDWVARCAEHATAAGVRVSNCAAELGSASSLPAGGTEIVVTDPPYYDAIPYSDLMDFFYVWLRRTLLGFSPETDAAFQEPLSPKWNHETKDGELIDDSSRFGGDKAASKKAYEDGMFHAFQACHHALVPDGRMVVVFANKNPDAWETLVSATIRAGFVVDASWPIQTEMGNRTRALASAALASSVWLVCKKRPETARPGWDNRVLDEMRENIHTRLREYWDAGIRGPDFVWAATGPALEAYSKHPIVKKANQPGAVMQVSEFLRAVRRIVVDFVVGRVLNHNGGAETVSGLDDVTTYYLLHRHDFGMKEAPIGACILYAISCGLSDTALAGNYEVLQKTGGQRSVPLPDGRGRSEGPGEGPQSASGPSQFDDAEADEALAEGDDEGTGGNVRLRPWSRRIRKGMGFDADGRPAPLIDQVHRLMHLWRAGDVVKVDEYIEARGLRRSAIFAQLLQALIELAPAGDTERSLLESISNHLASRGPTAEMAQREMDFQRK